MEGDYWGFRVGKCRRVIVHEFVRVSNSIVPIQYAVLAKVRANSAPSVAALTAVCGLYPALYRGRFRVNSEFIDGDIVVDTAKGIAAGTLRVGVQPKGFPYDRCWREYSAGDGDVRR